MGVVVPEGFDLRSLADAAEVRVVEACRDGLSDGWFVMPHVCLTGRRDFELDLVLAHRELGVLDLEVKSHQVSIEAGEWVSSRGPLRPQPYDQARHNAYELRGWLRDRCGAPRLDVDHAVAFPNTAARLAPLPPGIRPQQLITAEELDDLDDALERLMTSRPANRPLGEDLFERIVGSLRPDATVSWDPLARARRARDRLEDICAERVRAVATLDVNRRGAGSGAAGTGKSRLAVSWALRSFAREERTLLTCYNEPLAAWLSSRLPDDDALTVGAFLRMGLALPGLPPCDPPADAGDDWWNVRAVGHLVRHWSSITTRFDTIIVDEAQDFSPAWLALLGFLATVAVAAVSYYLLERPALRLKGRFARVPSGKE